MNFKLFFKKILGSRYRKFVNFFRTLFWLFPVITTLFLKVKNKKRLLIIYDLTTQPFSIGDILTVQEASLVLKENCQVDLIDFAIVCDQDVLKKSSIFFKKINSDNYFFYLSSILPVTQVNPFLGSIHAFNSYEQLNTYISANYDDVKIWPSGWRVKITREYLYYTIFEDLLYPYFLKMGRVPKLSSRKPLEIWAKNFYQKYAGGDLPVTVNIRNNQFFQKSRNVNIDIWIDFFKYAEKNYRVKFFVICALSEIDDRLKLMPNVVVIKDWNTNIEQDLALIDLSAIHLGAASGPASMAFFSDKPYLIVKGEMHLQHFSNKNLIKYSKENIQQFVFANKNQRFLRGEESLDMLIENFNEIWESFDRFNYFSGMSNMSNEEMPNWLR